MKQLVTEFTSQDGPALASVGASIFLAWADKGNNLQMATVTANGVAITVSQAMPVREDGRPQETSFARPALAVVNNQLWIAWSGTNQAHSLSVAQWDIPNRKLAPNSKFVWWNQTSPFAPTLAATDDGNLELGWTGSDGAHSLSFAQLTLKNGLIVPPTAPPQVPGRHGTTGPAMILYPGVGHFVAWNSTDLSEPPDLCFSGLNINFAGLDYNFHVYNGNPAPPAGQDFSLAGPSFLFQFLNGGAMTIGYAGEDHHLYFLTMGGGVIATPAYRMRTNQDTSRFAPGMCDLSAQVNLPRGAQSLVAWTATNGVQSICLQDFDSLPMSDWGN